MKRLRLAFLLAILVLQCLLLIQTVERRRQMRIEQQEHLRWLEQEQRQLDEIDKTLRQAASSPN